MKKFLIGLTIVFYLAILGEVVWAQSLRIVQPGDILDIYVEGQPHMDTTAIVSRDGTFYYRYSGEVKAKGLTPQEVAQAVTGLIRKSYSFLDNPKVKVVFREQSQTVISDENLFLDQDNPQFFESEGEGDFRATEASYRIGPNDRLTITVYDEPELSRTIVVSEIGTIIFPFVGEIRVSSFTPNEVAKKIEDILGRDYLVNPQVSVLVAEYAKFFIFGAVNKEGSYEAKGELTLIDALALAGGAKPEADLSKIKVLRKESGESKEIILDLETEGRLFFLKPKDNIMVPEYGKVFILGEVKSPGSYYFKKNLTVVEIIAMAGGFTNLANKNAAQVVRGEGQSKQVIKVPVANILKSGDKSQDIFLEENDTIIVPESLF
ncbi:MAG: polysaccharide biosynthesis/export family protein [Candidatus Omnitrophica bacterium]|nr:polysaccharide biosynthesis/export family protein [Candidatus Omnitrophota bacterium]